MKLTYTLEWPIKIIQQIVDTETSVCKKNSTQTASTYMPKQPTPATSTLFPINHKYHNICLFYIKSSRHSCNKKFKHSDVAPSRKQTPPPASYPASRQLGLWSDLTSWSGNKHQNHHFFCLVWNQMVWRKHWGKTNLIRWWGIFSFFSFLTSI